MTIDEFIAEVEEKLPPAPPDKLAKFETLIGSTLPDDYRYFLINCNGGSIGGYWYEGTNPNGEEVEAGVHHIGGFRDESYFSLPGHLDTYKGRIPAALMWINDDPFGNAICLGIDGKHRGRVYFWDHENEPDDEDWNESVETAGNITLVANSFTEFVTGLQKDV